MKKAAQTAVSLVKLESIEQRHIDDVLQATLGNRTLAAKLLGIDRSTLNRKLARRRAAEQRNEG
jgi:DNA-binding protein Fis